MAKHFKSSVRGNKMAVGVIVAIVTVTVLAVLVACFAVANSGALYTIADLFSPEQTTTLRGTSTSTTVSTTEPSQNEEPPVVEPEPEPEYAVPNVMKGVWLTPGVDYLISGKENAAAVKKQIDTAFATIDEWEFNTLLVPLHRGEQALYPSQEMDSMLLAGDDGKQFDSIAYIVEQARARDMYVYGVLDLHIRDGAAWDPRVEGVADRTVRIAEECAPLYSFDGMFVDGFAFALGDVKAEERETAVAALTDLVTRVSQTLTAVHRDFYVGLMSYGIWAHKSVDERGSNTREYYEEFTDGCADTRGWLEQGLFHAVMVKNYASTSHPTGSFQKVLEWWDATARAFDVPLYMSHSAKTAGSYLAGWSSPDQLAQQYLYCKDSQAWCGSAYDSLAALRTDKNKLASTLKQAYAGTLNEEFIYNQLTVSSPNKTTFTTTESSVTFNGGGDTNFPLTVNGQTVALSEHGFFTHNVSLKVGLNTIVFSHKGKTRTYNITYKQTLVSAVSPAEDMTVDGGSMFLIRATARKGSSVTAVINGKTITLQPTDDKMDESGNLPTDFQSFMGSYTLPEGVIGKEQALGAVKVTATYNGLTESMTGGKVTVEALPVPVTTTTTTTTTTVGDPNDPTGSTKPNEGPTLPKPGDKDIVIITAEYAETFNGGTAIEDWSRPYNSYLPKGTQDLLVSKVYNGSLSYYLLGSGKRVYQKDAMVVKGAAPSNTTLTDGSAVVNGMYTVLTFDADWDIPVYIAAYPQKYYADTATGTPNYSLEKYGQTAEYVDVTFHYVSTVPTAPDLSGNALFSSAQWLDNGSGVWTLRLTLKKKGNYYGHRLVWRGDRLTLSFLNPADISQNTAAERLKGVRVLIDPGHGSSDDKPWEGPFNLLYANELKTKLEALGATVVMTRDKDLGDVGLSLQARVAMAHAEDFHMVISVHMNGYDGNATGATVHYYNEAGYTLSSYIFPKMHEVEVPYGVGTTANGRPRSSGTVWGTLYMTRSIFDCPSVLLECAFLDNPKDKEALIDPVYRDKLMQAVADGVVAYFEDRQ